jgi:hypothetical protein
MCPHLLSLRWGVSDRYKLLSHVQNQKSRKQEEGDLQVETTRVWNEVTWKNWYDAFLKSLPYAKYLEDDKTKQHVTRHSKTNPASASNCHVSQLLCQLTNFWTGSLYEAIQDAVISHPTISQQLEKCNCTRHAAHWRILVLNHGEEWISNNEDNSNLGDDKELPLMWEPTLTGWPINFVKSMCCAEIEYPNFCVEVGSKTTEMLNWKCHTKDLNKSYYAWIVVWRKHFNCQSVMVFLAVIQLCSSRNENLHQGWQITMAMLQVLKSSCLIQCFKFQR